MTNNHFLAKILNPMDESFQKKCDRVKKKFAPLSPQERYSALIQMGRELPLFSPLEKIPENLVKGCQSLLYLSARLEGGKLFFNAQGDALISTGLAALLIAVYSGESPETILTESPRFLTDLGIEASLSFNRSNGLANIHLRMKQQAVKNLVLTQF